MTSSTCHYQRAVPKFRSLFCALRIPYDPRDSLSFAVHSLINPTSVYLCFPVGPLKKASAN